MSYDAVIIGSGVGGAVAACPLAERGQRVLVLERGRRRAPGEYPSSTDATGSSASATGYDECAAFGGRRNVRHEDFTCSSTMATPRPRRCSTGSHFEDVDGAPLTLSGFKRVRDSPGLDVWSYTSTLYARVLRGRTGAAEEAARETLASGIVALHTADFLRQLASFRPAGPTLRARLAATSRFGVFFLGKLWDVYANRVLQYGPF